MGREVTVNVKVAEKQLTAVKKALTQSVANLAPAFQGAATTMIQQEVYSNNGMAAQAAALAPVDTGALQAGLLSPDSSESFDKGRQSQSVFSVSPSGRGGVQYIQVEYGTDPKRDDGVGYAQYVEKDFLSGPAAKFQARAKAIGEEIARAIAAIIAAEVSLAATSSGYKSTGKQMSVASVMKLTKKFGVAPILTKTGRGYGYKALAGMSRSRYLKLMRQRGARTNRSSR